MNRAANHQSFDRHHNKDEIIELKAMMNQILQSQNALSASYGNMYRNSGHPQKNFLWQSPNYVKAT